MKSIFLKLFLAFTLIPVIEIYILIKLGTHIGALTTVLLVIATGIAGAFLARVQGFYTLFRIRTALRERRMPTQELIDAFLILVAGIVLLTPGFLTDAAGILLLIPATRAHAGRYLRYWITRSIFKIPTTRFRKRP
jgi:UPF0716 protein FxsA